MTKAVGDLWKNEAGNWHARVSIPSACIEVGPHKRMKDAVRIANAIAKMLGWDIKQWSK